MTTNNNFIYVNNKPYPFIRTESRFFDITNCNILTDGHVDDNDGLVRDAIPVHAEEVAYLIAEAEARDQQLERVESLLEEWINLRRFRSRKARQESKRSLQKKEVIN